MHVKKKFIWISCQKTKLLVWFQVVEHTGRTKPGSCFQTSSVYYAPQLTWLRLCLAVIRKLSTAQEKVERAGSRKRVCDAVSVQCQRVVASKHGHTSHNSLTVSCHWFLWDFLCPRRLLAPFVGQCWRFYPQPNSVSENLSTAAHLLARQQPSLE